MFGETLCTIYRLRALEQVVSFRPEAKVTDEIDKNQTDASSSIDSVFSFYKKNSRGNLDCSLDFCFINQVPTGEKKFVSYTERCV